MPGSPSSQVEAAWAWRRGRALALDVAVNIAAPALIFGLAHGAWGDVRALIASSVPPLLWSVIGFVRDRRIDAIALLAIAGVALSLLLLIGGGSPRLLVLREKMVTLLIGLAFLGSAAIGRPLIGPLARAGMARRSAAELADFDARRDQAAVRHTITVMTLAWGFGLLADVAVSVVLIFSLSIAQYLVVGPILLYATMGGLGLWTVVYRRHRQRLVRPETPR